MNNSYILHKISDAINADISIPGSKSYTNRALIMASMTEGPVVITNPLASDDVDAMLNCINRLGIGYERETDQIVVYGSAHDVVDKHYDLDCNISGTTIRFITALSCVVPGTKTIYGKEGLNKRPIRDLVDSLMQLDADISYVGINGFPPIAVRGDCISGGEVNINGAVSSQFVSALLMCSPLLERGLVANVIGEQISKPYVDMTIGMMREWGIDVKNTNHTIYQVASGQKYVCDAYNVEGDMSAAGYFVAIATLTKGTITLHNLNHDSLQADLHFFDILKMMGTEFVWNTDGSVTVRGNGVKPLGVVDMESCPDQAQTLAVLVAFVSGDTVITGIRSLRVKETERVRAVQNELAKMGVTTESTHDTLVIHGGNPHGATIDTYGDHRMAMAFAIAGTILDGMVINSPDVVSKSFPEFWNKLRAIGMKIETEDL